MAYLLKAKKNIEAQDINEFKHKKQKYLQRRKEKNELKDTAKKYEPNLLMARLAAPILQKYGRNDKAHIRYAEYIGTFSVPGTDHAVRSEFVKKQLNSIQSVVHTSGVLLIISPDGVIITDDHGQIIKMAHAMHRISYCTCIPVEKIFCFLSRQPRGPVNIQYCHMFITSEPSQAEEINTIMAKSFKMAQEAQKSLPIGFNSIVAGKLDELRVRFEEVQHRANKEREKNHCLLQVKQPLLPGEKMSLGDEDIVRESLIVDERFPWFQPKISREKATDYLLKQEIRGFIVRESKTYNGCYSLSVRIDKSDHSGGIIHFLLEHTNTGVRFKGTEKEWSNMASLILHHTVMPETLPCTLKLPEHRKPTEEQRDSQ